MSTRFDREVLIMDLDCADWEQTLAPVARDAGEAHGICLDHIEDQILCASGEQIAEYMAYREKALADPCECHSCWDTATHRFAGGSHCWPCVESLMDHGHRHVHDTPCDCRANVERLDGTGTDLVLCAEPMAPLNWTEA